MIKKSKNTALIFGEKKVDYNNLLIFIDHYTKLFKKEEGQRIAIFSENRLEWVYAFYACWKNDSIPVTIDFLSKPDEVAFILNDCEPNYIFTSENNRETLNKALKKLDIKPEIIVFEEVKNDFDEIEAEDFPEKKDEDTACIIYSSGTTGSPKGVMLSFKNLRVNVKAVSRDVPIFNKDETVLAMLPLHHILPLLGCIVCPLNVGGKVAFTPTLESEDIVKTLNDNNVTIIISVPRFYTVLFKGIKAKIEQKKIATLLFKLAGRINSLAFSKKVFKTIHQKFGGHLKYMVSGGAALNRSVEKGFFTLGFEVLSGYGMTETAPMITFPRPGKVRFGAVGQSLGSNEIKIAADGEILNRGPNVMKGYYNLPDKTEETIINGWLHTGDVGYIDKDGYLFITGRKKEIIVLPNGKNINPVNLEFDILKLTDTINEIGVFMHEDILQMVCTPDKSKVAEKGITDFRKYIQEEVISKFNDNVAPYKQIKKITVVEEELPKTRLDKLKRFKLKDLVPGISEKEESQTKEPEFKEYSVIRDFMRSQLEKKIFPNDHLEFDLGMDSLDKVSLQTFLKKTFDVDIQEIHLKEYPTVHKLSEFIKSKSKQIKHEAVNLSDVFKEKMHDVKLPKSWATHVIMRNILRFFVKLYFKVTIKDIEKLPQPPYIMAPNHQSFLDGVLVVSGLSTKQLRETYFFAKARWVKNWFVRFLARTSNIIVVDINDDLKGSLQKLAAAIHKEKNIIIFPEGTRSFDGKLNDFKKTFAILSSELNVPIVPVAIDGAFKALPRNKHFPRPGVKIEVKYLDPILPEGKDVDDLKEEVKNKIDEELN